MAVFTIPTCDQVVSCGPPSDWDLIFCICTSALEGASVCHSQKDQFTGINGDIVTGLTGQYSTSGNTVTTIAATPSPVAAAAGGYGGAQPGWTNTSGALDSEDGSVASAIATQQSNQTLGGYPRLANYPTDYLVVSDFGFSIPTNATVVSILVGYNAPYILRTPTPTHLSLDGAPYLYNAVTVCQGNTYYFFDPSSDEPRGVAASSPWPASGYYLDGVQQSPGTLPPGTNPDMVWPKYTFGQATFPSAAGGSWNISGCGFEALDTYGGVTQFKSPFGQVYPFTTPSPIAVTPSPSNTSWRVGQQQQGWVGIDSFATGCDAYYAPPVYGVQQGLIPTYELGPLAKGGFPLTPTKQFWTPDEVNDPSFGIGVSLGSTFLTGYNGSITQYITLLFGGFSIAVYYVAGVGGNPFANCTGVEFQ